MPYLKSLFPILAVLGASMVAASCVLEVQSNDAPQDEGATTGGVGEDPSPPESTGPTSGEGGGGGPQDCNGWIVLAESDCEPGADCIALTTGQWCVEASPAPCPLGARRLEPGAECAFDEVCTEAAGFPGVRCATTSYTVSSCELARDIGAPAPGNGSTYAEEGCGGFTALGVLEEADGDGARLCCATRHVRDCLGPTSLHDPACRALFRRCDLPSSAANCNSDETCSYRDVGEVCGQPSGIWVCLPRSASCAWTEEPLCGCEGEMHEAACSTPAVERGPTDLSADRSPSRCPPR